MKNYKEKSDGTLVELSLLGEQSAYEELVRRHEKSVLGTAYKVTNNEFSAEDASQDAFVSAWIKLDSLRDREKFGSWVCSIAKNCARTVVSHYRSMCGDISLHLLENTEAIAVKDDSIEERMDLHEAVSHLSDKIRETIELHYFEGMTVQEIASELGVSVGTIKWRLSEGRKLLRKEYGVMNDNNEEMTFVEKVMYQVEQLKLWRLKDDLTGVEKEYRMVLKNVEALEDSTEKQHALADVLLRGYWWVPGEKNDETFARIKQAALESHNEDVMESVIYQEGINMSNEDKIAKQIPFLEEHGFIKALGYVWFWIGYDYAKNQEFEKAIEIYKKVLEILKPEHVYYANALAAIAFETAAMNNKNAVHGAATGEVYKKIGNKWYFWSQPGYNRGNDLEAALFWNCSQCDSLMLDENMEEGQVIHSSNGKTKITCKGKHLTVETPSGIYNDCICTVLEGERYGLTYAETYFAPNIGIVKQIVRADNNEIWYLKEARINGGSGYLPFAEGNKWEYECVADPDIVRRIENVYEVTSASDNSATASSCFIIEDIGYADTWRGNILATRYNYYNNFNDELNDVRKHANRAIELAETERQKLHAETAYDVIERILLTDPVFNPDYTQKGAWNFFCYLEVDKEARSTKDNRTYSFEYKALGDCGVYGWKLLYSFLFDRLNKDLGTLWSDEWVPGYHFEKSGDSYYKKLKISMDVLENETVETAAGRFENCRHITYTAEGYEGGMGYGNGRKHYWFAPEIGVVKFETDFWGGTQTAIWELTEYIGKGDGYFPLENGLFRNYEPIDMAEGWRGSLTHTYHEDESGLVIFHNATGVKDRD